MSDTSYSLTTSYWLVVVAGLLASLSTHMIGSRFESGYYSLLMHKGGSHYTYMLSVYFTDVVVHFIVLCIFMIMQTSVGIKSPGIMLAIILFCFS